LVQQRVDESVNDLGSDTKQGDEAMALCVPNGLSDLGTATISALHEILGILNWRVHEVTQCRSSPTPGPPKYLPGSP